jgi:hypothetical protein
MVDEMDDVDRAGLRSLVLRWLSGELSERDVHEEAEHRWESRSWPVCDEQDDGSVAVEVLAQLEILNHQWITTEDVPAILAFLDTPSGQAGDGWRRWRAYWDSIDWDERRRGLAGRTYYVA